MKRNTYIYIYIYIDRSGRSTLKSQKFILTVMIIKKHVSKFIYDMHLKVKTSVISKFP